MVVVAGTQAQQCPYMTTADPAVAVEACSHQIAPLNLQILMLLLTPVAVVVAVETDKVQVTPVVTVDLA